MSFLSSSEFVSHGHPDRLADNIAAALIDRIQKKDGPLSHAAIEVFITRDTVIFGGEATTTLALTNELLSTCVTEGYHLSGYIPEMRDYWTEEEVALASDMKVVNKISPQSPDIALGTTDKGVDSGYNDQGVFFSSSENTNPAKLGLPMAIATDIGDLLSTLSLDTITHGGSVVLGPDNKVVVTIEVADDGYSPASTKAIKAITIAVAHSSHSDIERVRAYVKDHVSRYVDNLYERYGTSIADDCKWVINGTGKFVVHGASSDTSMTGRKISVNHPSAGPVWCNKMIGGGSLVKPWHASDFILNVACRFIANVVVQSGLSGYAIVGCASAIGQKEPQSLFVQSEYSDNSKIARFFLDEMDLSPSGLADLFDFWSDRFSFLSIVDTNFFGESMIQPWEDTQLLLLWSARLKSYLKND